MTFSTIAHVSALEGGERARGMDRAMDVSQCISIDFCPPPQVLNDSNDEECIREEQERNKQVRISCLFPSVVQWVEPVAETWRRVCGYGKKFRGPRFLNDVFFLKISIFTAKISDEFFWGSSTRFSGKISILTFRGKNF